MHSPSGNPDGLDEAIAAHAAARGHWPGRIADQIGAIIVSVRGGWDKRYSAPNGETIYRQGDIILIENPVQSEGTIFVPSSSALEYFRRWIRRNPGGTIRLSDREFSILLGATLMHWGVPFRHAARRDLTEIQQAIVDEASEKLIELREKYQRAQVQDAQEIPLDDEAAALLIAVVEDCLNECGNDATELHLQLKTRERDEVEALLERMRASLGSQFAKLA